MFDTHIHRRDEQHHHHHETVHEHRAPTDASVKLLMEMEEKALEKILASVRLIGCDSWCVVHYMHDHLMDGVCFIIRYRLAWQDVRTLQHRIHPYKLAPLGSHERIEQIGAELVKALAEDIAASILTPAMQKTLSTIQTHW